MFVGDVHGRWESLLDHIHNNDPDIVVQTGDFGYWPRFSVIHRGCSEFAKELVELGIPLYFCDGNHEDHESIALHIKKSVSTMIYPGVYYCKRGSMLQVGDHKILFYGGATSIDRDMRTPKYDWFEEEVLRLSETETLTDEQRACDIVVSHTAPEKFFDDRIVNGLRFEDESRYALDQVYEQVKPTLWVFGHFHKKFEGMYENTEWKGLDCCHTDSNYPNENGCFMVNL
jgi:Icc-related predicted phosphoesterase